MKKLLFVILALIYLNSNSQTIEYGFNYAPFLSSKLTFDKKYIIFSNYTSLMAGDNKAHNYPSLLSTGMFLKYKLRNQYFQAEFNLYENKFKKQIPDWKTINDKYFNFSSIQIPVMYGFTVNPGSMFKFSLFCGLNNNIGKFRNVFFSTLTYTDNTTVGADYFYQDRDQKKELMERFRNYYLNAYGGLGISYYATSINLKAERNITGLNRRKLDYSANFVDLFVIRAYLSISINRGRKPQNRRSL